MLGWFAKKRVKFLEEETKKSFEAVKKDIDNVGKWIKHLDGRGNEAVELFKQLKEDLSTLREEFEDLREEMSVGNFITENKQLSKKQTAVGKQTAVYDVGEPVQTAVQTANFYEILQGFSTSERMLIFTLMNAADDMKLSYEDLARLLGKERSTVRGQINAIKQKSESLIRESSEANGKKRVYIDPEIKEKLQKYAKVRVKGKRKR